MKAKYWLYIILLTALVFRTGGILYGLPLWVIGDEPSLVTGALKMLELKTIFPFLHIADLKATLYFPPYLSLLYMPFFALLTGVKFLFFSGTFDAFKNYLISDLSHFFILERLIHLVFSVASVWLTYKIAKNIFTEERVALLSAIFLATSVTHIYSAFYHWGPAIFLMTLALYYLTDHELNHEKRYLRCAVIAGIAFGVSLIAGFIMLFAFFWYFLYEKHTVSYLMKDRAVFLGLLLFFALTVLSIAVYTYGFHLSGDNSIGQARSLGGYLASLWEFYGTRAVFEPALFICAIIGLCYAFRKDRRYFWTIFAQLVSYATVFYFVFHYEPRFTAYMFPLLAITAGYGVHNLLNSMLSPVTHRVALLVIFVLPVLTCLQFMRLELKNDPRTQAWHWANSNLPAETKVVTYAELMRLPSNKLAVAEKVALDPTSRRQIDVVESAGFYAKGVVPLHSLNLSTVSAGPAWENMAEHIRSQQYEYLIYDPNYTIRDPNNVNQLEQLAKGATLLATFGTPGFNIMGPGHFPNIITFLGLKTFDPEIRIYKL